MAELPRPVIVGPLWVGPPWEEPQPGSTPVVIDPGRAFGTGAHETTRLCLELLLEVARGSFLDVGCGSGVLAIAAAKLGFAPVVALDSTIGGRGDATQREGERRRARPSARRCHADPCRRRTSPSRTSPSRPVEALGRSRLRRAVIASGYLVADEPAPAGFRRLERRTGEGCAADLFARE